MKNYQLNRFECPDCGRLLFREDCQGTIEIKCRRCDHLVVLQKTIEACRDCPALKALPELLDGHRTDAE